MLVLTKLRAMSYSLLKGNSSLPMKVTIANAHHSVTYCFYPTLTMVVTVSSVSFKLRIH